MLKIRKICVHLLPPRKFLYNELKKPIQHWLEYGAVLIFGIIVRTLPLNWALFFGAFLGQIAFSVVRVRRRVTLSNLTLAFGKEKGMKELKRIGASTYRNLGRSFVEYSRFPSYTREEIEKLVNFEGLEHFDMALRRGKGAVLVTGHFGDWELMGAAIALKGFPLHFLVGEQHNKRVDNLMNRYREMMGIKIIPLGISIRKGLQALKENQFVAMLSDQDAGKDGIFVQFFGHPASTPQGPAAFALKTDALLGIGFIIREKNGHHRVIIEKPIEVQLSGDGRRDIIHYTQVYTSMLENYVKKYPDHYFWPHRRWKTKKK